MPKTSKSKPEYVEKLAANFHRNGYVRYLDPKQLKREGTGYHKGDEVRLVANTMNELRIIRRLLREAGFTPGKPFAKSKQWRQPIYGRENVLRFLELIEVEPNPKSVRGRTRGQTPPRGRA